MIRGDSNKEHKEEREKKEQEQKKTERSKAIRKRKKTKIGKDRDQESYIDPTEKPRTKKI